MQMGHEFYSRGLIGVNTSLIVEDGVSFVIRISRFTSRHAYLILGTALDDRNPGTDHAQCQKGRLGDTVLIKRLLPHKNIT